MKIGILLRVVQIISFVGVYVLAVFGLVNLYYPEILRIPRSNTKTSKYIFLLSTIVI